MYWDDGLVDTAVVKLTLAAMRLQELDWMYATGMTLPCPVPCSQPNNRSMAINRRTHQVP